jgi:hypothetical protein
LKLAAPAPAGLDPHRVMAQAAECIGQFVASGTLDYARLELLKECYFHLWMLDGVLTAEGEVGLDRLRTMARLVLEGSVSDTSGDAAEAD